MDLSKYKVDQLSGDLYPLIYTICKGRFEKIHNDSFSPSQESLAKEIAHLEKEAERVRRAAKKMNGPSSEGL